MHFADRTSVAFRTLSAAARGVIQIVEAAARRRSVLAMSQAQIAMRMRRPHSAAAHGIRQAALLGFISIIKGSGTRPCSYLLSDGWRQHISKGEAVRLKRSARLPKQTTRRPAKARVG